MLRAVVLAAIAGAPQPSVTPVVPIVTARLLNRTLRKGTASDPDGFAADGRIL